MPRVSVIITMFNAGPFIAQTLASVIHQSFSDWELILINDGSTDNTDAIVRPIAAAEPRCHYVSYSANRGIIACASEALQQAQGEYIARLDADDVWSDAHKLQKQVQFLEQRPNHVLVGSWAEVIDLRGKKLYEMKPPTEDQTIHEGLLIRNRFINSSVLFRRDVAVQAGGYMLGEEYGEDYGLALRLGRLGKMANLPQFMVQYRINPAGYSQNNVDQRIPASLKLIKQQREAYPHYFRAVLQWRMQYWLYKLGGMKLLNTLKSWFY